MVGHLGCIAEVGGGQGHNQELVLALEVRCKRGGEGLQDDLDLDGIAWSYDRGIGSDAVQLGCRGFDLECQGCVCWVFQSQVLC